MGCLRMPGHGSPDGSTVWGRRPRSLMMLFGTPAATDRPTAAGPDDLDRASVHLAHLGFEPPGGDLANWEHLARVVEVDPATPPAEVYSWAIAWIDRQRLMRRIAREPDPAVMPQGSVDDRLRAFLLDDPRRFDSTAAELAAALRCSKSAVAGTDAWKTIMAGRAVRRENLRREGLL